MNPEEYAVNELNSSLVPYNIRLELVWLSACWEEYHLWVVYPDGKRNLLLADTFKDDYNISTYLEGMRDMLMILRKED
jgi:hypothetical protein